MARSEGTPRWLSSRIGDSYPFVPRGVEDLVGGDDLRVLFAEAIIRLPSYPSGSLKLTAFDYAGPGYADSSFSGLLADDSGTVLDSEGPEVTKTLTQWGDWLVLQWYDAASGVVAVFTLYAPAIAEITFPFAGSLELTASCVDVRERGVVRVRIRNKNGVPSDWVDGDIVLAEGYNTEVTGEEPLFVADAATGTHITLAAGSGLGLGAEPSCDDVQLPAVRNFGGATGDAFGRILLNSKSGCYLIGRTGTNSAHTLLLKNICGVCCSCDDYVQAYELLKVNEARLNMLAGNLVALKPIYDDLAAYLHGKKAEERIIPILKVVSKPGYYVSLQAFLANSTGESFRAGQFDFSVTLTGAPGFDVRRVDDSVYAYTPKNGWVRLGDPAYSFSFPDKIEPAEAAGVQLQIFVPYDISDVPEEIVHPAWGPSTPVYRATPPPGGASVTVACVFSVGGENGVEEVGTLSQLVTLLPPEDTKESVSQQTGFENPQVRL